ncbi:hypothetical protein V502_02835, partial [Pseudogymnoascus sp. VKM F-4520 (FW-2644)]
MYNVDKPCHFCVISSTNYPSQTPSIAASPMNSAYVVLSTPTVFAVLDIAPLARGHVLLIPRVHCEKLSDLNPEQSAVVGFWLPIVSRGVMAGLLGIDWESKGMSWNVVQANGRQAGQTIKHAHFHIIPRPRPEMLSLFGTSRDVSAVLDYDRRVVAVAEGLGTRLGDDEGLETCMMIKTALRKEILRLKREGKIVQGEENWELWSITERGERGMRFNNHIHSQLGLAILPTDVKLITKPEDLYQWSILTPGKAALFNKQLSKHSTGAYIDLCNGVGVHFKAVLGKGAADYGQETRLVTTSTAFDEPEKNRQHDTITFQLSAKEWRERFNAEVAIKEALEIEMMGIKGENAELLTEIKALREEEATRTRDLEKAREALLVSSHILQERALKASEDSQKITHA